MQTLELHNISITSNGTIPSVPFLAIKDKVLGKKYELSIAFVTPAKAKVLNITHRNKDYIPNTLSFSLTKTSGEIVLCMSAIRKQYKEFGMDLQKYLVFIVIHSMLHLKGMEHGGTMERKEKQLLTFFTTSTPSNETTHRSRH